AGCIGSTAAAGAAARLSSPSCPYTALAGTVYVGDIDNNTIRKITSAGAVSTLAGTARVTGSADGSGAAASFDGPGGVATDSAGNVYVADTSNHTIRKSTSGGGVTPLGGTAGLLG